MTPGDIRSTQAVHSSTLARSTYYSCHKAQGQRSGIDDHDVMIEIAYARRG
jgi:hypothetical protein